MFAYTKIHTFDTQHCNVTNLLDYHLNKINIPCQQYAKEEDKHSEIFVLYLLFNFFQNKIKHKYIYKLIDMFGYKGMTK